MIKQPNEVISPDAIAARVSEYVRGFGRNNAEGLALLIAYQRWKVMAQWELDARASHFLTLLSDGELEAISRGDVDLPKIAREILLELNGGKP